MYLYSYCTYICICICFLLVFVFAFVFTFVFICICIFLSLYFCLYLDLYLYSYTICVFDIFPYICIVYGCLMAAGSKNSFAQLFFSLNTLSVLPDLLPHFSCFSSKLSLHFSMFIICICIYNSYLHISTLSHLPWPPALCAGIRSKLVLVSWPRRRRWRRGVGKS